MYLPLLITEGMEVLWIILQKPVLFVFCFSFVFRGRP